MCSVQLIDSRGECGTRNEGVELEKRDSRGECGTRNEGVELEKRDSRGECGTRNEEVELENRDSRGECGTRNEGIELEKRDSRGECGTRNEEVELENRDSRGECGTRNEEVELENRDSSLLGDTLIFEAELYRYKNTHRKNTIEKQLIDFERKIKLYRYLSVEIINDLAEMYNFALQYYARYILKLIHTYQTFDKNAVKDVYYFLSEKLTVSEKELLNQDYDKYNVITPPHQVIIKLNEVSSEVKEFIVHLHKIYNSNLIIEKLNTKNIYTLIQLIEDGNMTNLLKFSFEHEIVELFIFIYLFTNAIFDYRQLISPTFDSNMVQEITSNTNVAKVESDGGSIGCNIFITESKEKVEIYKKMYSLKKYSHMIGPHKYRFVKKYITYVPFLNSSTDFDSVYTFCEKYNVTND